MTSLISRESYLVLRNTGMFTEDFIYNAYMENTTKEIIPIEALIHIMNLKLLQMGESFQSFVFYLISHYDRKFTIVTLKINDQVIKYL